MPIYNGQPDLPINFLPQLPDGGLGMPQFPQYGQQFSGGDMFRLMQEQLGSPGYGLYGLGMPLRMRTPQTPPREQAL